MITTRFYFTLLDSIDGSSSTFEKNIDMPYRITVGEEVTVNNKAGSEVPMKVKDTYFDLSRVELAVSLGEFDIDSFKQLLKIFLADGWGML